MSYLGQVELKSSEIRRVDVTSSTSATHTLTWTPPSEQSLIITINGIKQQNNYTISGTTLTLDSALVSTDELEVVGILDIGVTNIPADDSITTAMVKDDAVTAAKLANSINTEITANTAKVTNATHTGDVTGATALTIAVDAVDIAMLSATGTAGATTFLRGDNSWAAIGDANTPYFHAKTTADSSWGAASYTTIVLNSVVAESNTGSFDTSTYRFTVPAGEGGTYFTGAQLFVPSSVGAYYLKCKQGASGTELNYSANQTNGNQNVQPAWIIVLAAGDYLEWSLYGGSGTTNGGTAVWGWKLW
jgi:hypothetical protein